MDNYSRESKWHSQAEGGLRVVDHGAMKVEFKFRLYCGNKSTLRAIVPEQGHSNQGRS